MIWPELIHEYRKKKGWTVKETLYHCNVTHDTLFGRTAGRGPSIKKALNIVRVLEIPIHRLLEVEF